ncbi:hypothetical protein [Bradyrhizobium sp. SZCCHNR2026]|uniref:hypothetical protein n=1 Tax=Bradyrhizobium sp. SZCCHNR2026 TaxID=3057381 RepID=UPI002915E29C|nr:hypothetical protein [Bradyrhizobium sp. SZCCHNR2026]
MRWRLSEHGDTALLVIADSDATDHFGSPFFECRKASGLATAFGDTDDDLRTEMATLILHDETPGIKTVPDDGSVSIVNFEFGFVSGWRYRFMLSATGPPFEELKRTGTFDFKVGQAELTYKFDVGLDVVAEFQGLCRMPDK